MKNTYSIFYYTTQIAAGIYSLRLASQMSEAICSEEYDIYVYDQDGRVVYDTKTKKFHTEHLLEES